jgi:predicted alpha/beta hydrolase
VPLPGPQASEVVIRFAALDGTELGGVLFEPAAGAPIAHAVVVNCGGGVPAIHYAHFARHLAAHGVAVLTYDYRGIGRSRPPQLRSFQADVEDWSEWDCGGAIAELRRRYPTAETTGVGHSIGAMMFGGAPNASRLDQYVFVGAHTGYVGDYRPAFRLPMAFLWHVFMPLVTRAVGYFPGRILHLGDDIPKGVALQWAGRRAENVNQGQDANVGTRASRLLSRLKDLSGRVLVVSVSDDAFATEAGTRRLLDLYPRLVADRLVCRPKDIAQPRIGHFGFFRRSSAALWPTVLAYILRAPRLRAVDEASAAHRDVGGPSTAPRIFEPGRHETANYESNQAPG